MNASPDSLYEQVKALIVEETQISPGEVLPEATIEDDLGVCGDDTWELMEVFSERFNVDMSEFEFQEHFASEGSGCLAFFWLWMTNQKPPEVEYYQPVTVQHLVQVAERKTWFNPPPLH